MTGVLRNPVGELLAIASKNTANQTMRQARIEIRACNGQKRKPVHKRIYVRATRLNRSATPTLTHGPDFHDPGAHNQCATGKLQRREGLVSLKFILGVTGVSLS